eukprot:448476_1
MHAIKRANISCLMHKIKFNYVSKNRFCQMHREEEDEEHCLHLEVGDNKHILVMGVFHHNYSQALNVQNAINTLQPDAVFLELCPWRGYKLEKIQNEYSKAYHYSPRDVESSAIFTASKLNAKLIYGDVSEQAIKNEIKKYDENVYEMLSNTQISMNDYFEFYNYDNNKDKDNDNNIVIHNDNQNGKQYIL